MSVVKVRVVLRRHRREGGEIAAQNQARFPDYRRFAARRSGSGQGGRMRLPLLVFTATALRAAGNHFP